MEWVLSSFFGSIFLIRSAKYSSKISDDDVKTMGLKVTIPSKEEERKSKKLYNRGYVQFTPPMPTDTGIALTAALENFAQNITKPDMTSHLEQDMDDIAAGKKQKEAVIKESQDILDGVLDTLEQNKTDIGSTIRDALVTRNSVGKCLNCDGEMVIRSSRKGKRFIGCSKYPDCDLTFPLPQQGKIIPMNTTCKSCGAPIINVINRNQKPWRMCININCSTKKNIFKNNAKK